ncbi:unnamed protein product [Sphagnum jensenii]
MLVPSGRPHPVTRCGNPPQSPLGFDRREKVEHWPADFFNPALGRKNTVPRGRLADPRAPVSRALNYRRISRRIPPGDLPPPRGQESPRGGQSFTSCGGESVDVVGPVAFLLSESSSSPRRIQDLPGILYPLAYASMETVLFFRCSISCCS